MNPKIIVIPLAGEYHNHIKNIIENLTGCQVITPPKNPEEILNLGSLYSPLPLCLPFKYNLGNYIYALRKGANIILQVGGKCLYGYYSELHVKILNDLGYHFTVVDITKNNHVSLNKAYLKFKELNHKLNIFKYIYYLIKWLLCIIFTEKISQYYLENYAKSTNKLKFNDITIKARKNLTNNKINIIKIPIIYLNALKEYKKIPTSPYLDPLKVLLIGDTLSLIDNHLNNYLETELLNNNIVIYKQSNLIKLIYRKENANNIPKKYLKYDLGGNSSNNISRTIKYVKQNIDGIIHLRSSYCIPEFNIIPILNEITDDYQTPILYLNVNDINNNVKISSFYRKMMDKRDKKRNNKK